MLGGVAIVVLFYPQSRRVPISRKQSPMTAVLLWLEKYLQAPMAGVVEEEVVEVGEEAPAPWGE